MELATLTNAASDPPDLKIVSNNGTRDVYSLCRVPVRDLQANLFSPIALRYNKCASGALAQQAEQLTLNQESDVPLSPPRYDFVLSCR